MNLFRSLAGPVWLIAAVSPLAQAAQAPAGDAAAVVRAAIDYWRDVSSYSVSELTIHRPDWERTVVVRVWTKGEKLALVRVVSPPKDAGNSTLLVGDDMWSYAPKVGRVIKLPASMMNQTWLGSDFSNNDLAKADDIVSDFSHRLLKVEEEAGRRVSVIESVPKESAPVPWGREVLRISDDHLLLGQEFYDQDGILVKRLLASEVAVMGGKPIVSRERMERADRPGEWTAVVVREARFGLDLPGRLFTLANLSHPRESP